MEGWVTKTSLLTVQRQSPWYESAGGPCGSAGSHITLLLLHHHRDARGADVPPLRDPSSRTSASQFPVHWCQQHSW